MKRAFVVFAALVVAGDQYSKYLVVKHFMPDESRILIPHALWLT